MNRNANSSSAKSNLFNTLIVMASTFLSRILGFVRNAVIAAIFSDKGPADPINFVFMIPNTFRKVTAEGGLSTAFIPVISKTLEEEKDKKRADILAQNILGLQALILIPLIGISMIFSEQIIRFIYHPEGPAAAEQILQAIELFRFFIWYLLLISMAALMMGVLNSENKFFIPAMTPNLFSVMVISALLLLTESLWIHAMSVGILIGGMAQIVFQYPQYRSLGYHFRFRLDFNNKDFQKVLSKWLPSIGIALAFILAQFISSIIAATIEDGSITAMQNALLFYNLPRGLFSISIATVFFPKMARFRAKGDLDNLSHTYFQGLGLLSAFMIPSAVALFFLGNDVIATVLLRGAFSPEGVLRANSLLTYYALGLFSLGAFNFIQRFFFSLGKYKTPFAIASITMVVDVVLSLILTGILDLGFKDIILKWNLGASALAISNSIAFTIGFLAALILTIPHIDFKNLGDFLITFLKVLLACIPLGLGLFFYREWRGDAWQNGASLENILHLIGVGVFGMGLVFGLYLLMRVDVLSILRRKDSNENEEK
jgi:putative peptidoglycan lipid II flippase